MTFVAVLVGIVMGSAMTLAVLYLTLFSKKTNDAQNNVDEPEATRSLDPGPVSASRSLSPSSSSPKHSAYAAAVSHSQGDGLLSGITAQLWSHMNVAIAKSVRESVEPMFKEMLPGPLASLHFTHLDLGTVPIHMDNVIVHEMQNDSVQFDMDIVWDGDCNIRLKADYVGSFGVQRVKLFGRMSVVLAPLIKVLPVVSAIQYCFINPPTLELDFTGLANIADCSLLDTKIRKIIQDTLQGMMVLPNRMMVKLDPANDFMETYRPPVGIARVTAVRGNNFQVEERALRKSDVPDVFCKFQLGGKEWKTSTAKNCSDPEWTNEAGDFVVCDHDQIISIHAWDEDTGTLDGDDYLGGAQVTVGEVLLAGKTKTVDLIGGQHKGASVTIRCDIFKLTSNLSSLESNENENLLSGFLTILVTQAEGLPVEKEEASSFAKVKYGSDFEFVTPTVAHSPGIDALNPVYDSVFHIPFTPKLTMKKDSIEFQLVNGEDTVIGTTTLTHNDLVRATDSTITENRNIGDKGATLKFRACLQGVEQPLDTDEPLLFGSSQERPEASATSSSVTHSTALGTVRVTAAKGWGFVAEKRRLHRNDIPDVYCIVTFGSSPNVWRTSTVKNSVTPEWNEFSDYLLSDHGQMVSITVFDEDKRGNKDDELGGARITVGKLLLADGLKDVELHKDGKPTGMFISLKAEMLE